MKAMILAGGKGKRLKPVTDYVPKPLVPINNIPIIEWQIRYLKQFGVKQVVVCTGYKTEMIERYLNVKDFGVKIDFSVEKTPLGTGGAIKKAAKLIKEKSFFVINGDVITDIDMRKLAKTNNSIAAIKARTKFGILDIDENENKIKNFKEKKEISCVWMNAGLYHLDKDIIKDLPSKGDIEKTAFPKYAKNERLNTVVFKNARWLSIDSLKDMEEASSEIGKIIK